MQLSPSVCFVCEQLQLVFMAIDHSGSHNLGGIFSVLSCILLQPRFILRCHIEHD